MEPADVEIALEWAAIEGWNPGRHDAIPFRAADPNGFLIGTIDAAPAAVISCVRYGEGFGFVGLYIVRTDIRDHGHGIEIWNAGHERFGERTVGLDSVDEQVTNYERDEYRSAGHTYRYRAESGGPAANPPPGIEPVRYEDVVELDRRCFPAAREEFLRSWLARPEGRALGLRRNGELAGYGVLRRCREGYKIGPLFAADAAAAEALLDALVAGIERPYTVDVPRANAAGTELMEGRGMLPVFRTSRMYRGEPPEIDHDSIFGVTTLELG